MKDCLTSKEGRQQVEMNNIQRATLVSALKKELEKEEKAYRGPADAEIMDAYAKTGAKTFDVALENDVKRIPIGTASVVTREGEYEVDDFEAWRPAATDAGLVDYTFRICPGYESRVMAAIAAADMAGYVQWEAKPAKDWQKQTVEVAGKLVFSETGEEVEGVVWVPGKTYTMLRPKSLDLVNNAVRALFGSTPMALLEGDTNA